MSLSTSAQRWDKLAPIIALVAVLFVIASTNQASAATIRCFASWEQYVTNYDDGHNLANWPITPLSGAIFPFHTLISSQNNVKVDGVWLARVSFELGPDAHAPEGYWNLISAQVISPNSPDFRFFNITGPNKQHNALKFLVTVTYTTTDAVCVRPPTFRAPLSVK